VKQLQQDNWEENEREWDFYREWKDSVIALVCPNYPKHKKDELVLGEYGRRK
jgi:hypothetical protein